MKGYVKKRERYNTRPWRGVVFGRESWIHRDFWTQPEAFEWCLKKIRAKEVV